MNGFDPSGAPASPFDSILSGLHQYLQGVGFMGGLPGLLKNLAGASGSGDGSGSSSGGISPGQGTLSGGAGGGSSPSIGSVMGGVN